MNLIAFPLNSSSPFNNFKSSFDFYVKTFEEKIESKIDIAVVRFDQGFKFMSDEIKSIKEIVLSVKKRGK